LIRASILLSKLEILLGNQENFLKAMFSIKTITENSTIPRITIPKCPEEHKIANEVRNPMIAEMLISNEIFLLLSDKFFQGAFTFSSFFFHMT
jgi:hypothetical protein